MFRSLKAEKNVKRSAELKKKIAELFDNAEKSKQAAAGGDLEKIIAELFRAMEQLKSGHPVSQAILERARELAESWHPEFGKSGNLLLVFLAGLVAAQKREIESLGKLRQRFTFNQPSQKLKSKQKYDIGRCYVPVVGEIEWEFGGVRPPDTSDMNDKTMNCLKPPEPPTCLDDIFSGHAVNMLGLVRLFGRDRHLLANLAGARIEKGRKTLVRLSDGQGHHGCLAQ